MTKSIRLRKPSAVHQESTQVESTGLPSGWANDPFVYVHLPNGWAYDETHGFLPVPAEIILKPGVNGTGEDRSASKAKAGFLEKGGEIISYTDPRLGKWKNYVGKWPVRSAVPGTPHGWRYAFRSCGFDVLANNAVRPVEAPEDWAEFRKHLRDSGIVPPMDEAVYMGILDREEKQLSRAIKAATENPHLGEAVTRRKDRIAKMKAAWEAYCATFYTDEVAADEPDAPAEQPKRGRVAVRATVAATPEGL